jgi:hypothetical protein
LVRAAAELCRGATLLRAAEASLVYAAAATSAAATKVIFVIVFLHMVTEAKQARLLEPVRRSACNISSRAINGSRAISPSQS